MTGILKLGTSEIDEIVRPLDWAARLNLSTDGEPNAAHYHSKSPSAPIRPTMNESFQRLEEENEKLMLALEQSAEEKEDIRKQALEEGRKQGRSEAIVDDQKRLTLIKETSESALAEFRDQLVSTESFAVLLARSGIRKVIGDEGQYGTLVAQSIRQYLETLDDTHALTISVSAQDFADDTALNDLAEEIGSSGLQILADGSLASGACQIKMRLGGVDIGIPGQLSRLDKLLTEMAGLAQ